MGKLRLRRQEIDKELDQINGHIESIDKGIKLIKIEIRETELEITRNINKIIKGGSRAFEISKNRKEDLGKQRDGSWKEIEKWEQVRRKYKDHFGEVWGKE